MKQKYLAVLDRLIRFTAICLAILILIVFAVALFTSENSDEAKIGSFDSNMLNDGWTIELNGAKSHITLPAEVNAKDGDTMLLSNVLPEDVTDGDELMLYSSIEDVYIYVGGKLRAEYSSDSVKTAGYYLPSAYVAADLTAKDAGKSIEIRIHVKDKGVISEVTLNHGNNAWFNIIKKNLAVNIIAVIIVTLGMGLVIVTLIIQKKFSNIRTAMSLGFLMICMGVWILSESGIRQIIFQKPSLTTYFSYLSIELLPALVCFYFDAVQHEKYHLRYIVLEYLVILQIIINMLLSFAGIAEFHETVYFSHGWMAVGIVLAIVNLVTDIVTGDLKRYKATAFGMLCFIICCIFELSYFYVASSHSWGAFICAGIIILMLATIVQNLVDERNEVLEREAAQTKSVVGTIETIASAIDAKDEYTGGHSDRVGRYAGLLAREMAADYDFSEEDIARIGYIGLMHDIGKIGVADSILNKAGKLTDEEFTLMKKHVEIGYELLKSMGAEIEGLLDGVRFHHERFDGKGYPEGLKETEIPLVARILCLADCYDAMTSNRVYRKRLTDEEVIEELSRCSGTQFDPALTEIFIRLIKKGSLKPETVDGMPVMADGTVLKSALLENRLQKAVLNGTEETKNPAHIRMACYIIKLMELRKRDVAIYFVGPDTEKYGSSGDTLIESWKALGDVLKDMVELRDINIHYSNEFNVVALFDRTPEKLEEFEDRIRNCDIEVKIERL